MKSLFLFFIVTLIFISCKTETKVYPDVAVDQIGKTLLWDMNYTQVKEILTEDFKLDFSKEIEQSGKNQIGKVYEFSGGKFNGTATKSWVAVLEYDSLRVLTINFENDNAQKIIEFEKQLTENLKPDSNYSIAENRWVIEEDGNRISEVQILSYPENKSLIVSYFKAFPKKY
jgi:hypothetical protein